MGAGIPTVLLNDTRVDGHHGCTAVHRTISTLSERSGLDIIAQAPAHQNWQSNRQVCDAIDHAALVLVNGEGTIHHGRLAAKWLTAAAPYAKIRGKPVALINAVWQGNTPDMADQAKAFDLISFRESASQTDASFQGLSARVVPDLALYQNHSTWTSNGAKVFTDSVDTATASKIHSAARSMGLQYISMFNDAMSLRERLSWLRHRGVRETILEPAARTFDFDDFLDYVCGVDLIVTGRFHMMIFAISHGIPFLAIGSNTHKNQATLKDAGLASWRLITPENLTSSLLDRAMKWDKEEREAAVDFVKTGRKSQEKLFDDLAGLVK